MTINVHRSHATYLLYQCVKETGIFTSVWRGFGFFVVCGGNWVLYKCAEEIESCTSLCRGLGFIPVSGGDWALYKCVGGMRFCTWKRLGFEPVCG